MLSEIKEILINVTVFASMIIVPMIVLAGAVAAVKLMASLTSRGGKPQES